MTIDEKKKKLRLLCSERRSVLNKNDEIFSAKLSKKIFEIKILKKAKIIASFISIKTEISTVHLNRTLFTLGKKICLPVISNNNKDLTFRLYEKNTSLIKGKFGILEPDEKSKELIPDIILTPCLAFDLNGYRLGYGGGYYDRTFFNYNKLGYSFTSIVIAYDGQKIKNVIRDHNDQKIDYILTEKKLYTNL